MEPLPTLHPGARAPRPEGLTLAGGARGRGAVSTGTRLPARPPAAPSDSQPKEGAPGHTHTHTPHTQRAPMSPGQGQGAGFSQARAQQLLFTFLASPGDQEPAPALRRPPPPPASLPPGRARTHSHTHAHSHPPGPGRSRGGNKTSWHVLRLQARPRRPADVKLQLGRCRS